MRNYECTKKNHEVWDDFIIKSKLVFQNGILPELLGKCFTRISRLKLQDKNNKTEYCYCNGAILSQMYPCSNTNC